MKISTVCETKKPTFKVTREILNGGKAVSVIFDERLTRAQIVAHAFLLLSDDELGDFTDECIAAGYPAICKA